MKTQPRPSRTAPHPFITLGGVLIAFALIVIALQTTLVSRGTMILIAVSFAFAFRWASRKSAAAMRERREREMERLRSTPVLHLND